MKVDGAVGSFAGPTGVGSLCLLAFFMVVDGFAKLAEISATSQNRELASCLRYPF